MNLSNIKLGEVAEIISVEANEFMKKRLIDLGMTPGTKIKPILESFKKEIVAYEIRKTKIALRKEDALKIKVRLIYD